MERTHHNTDESNTRPSTDDRIDDELDECEQEIAAAILEKLGDDDLAYFSAKQLAAATGCSSKKIAAHLPRIEKRTPIELTHWSDTNHTWQVERVTEGGGA